MNCRKYIFLFVLLAATVCTQAQGKQTQYFFERYDISKGLSDNMIESIKKDSRGFLWIATSNGLNRYDGYRFRKYFHNPEDSSSIPGSWVKSITEDKDGFLWIGFWNSGVAKYDYRTDKFIRMPLWFEEGYDLVSHIFCDNKNRIWIATSMGPYLYDNSGKLIKHWKSDTLPGSIPTNEIVHTFQDREGRIWMGTAKGVCRYDENTQSFITYKNTNPSYTVEEGNMWVNSSLEMTEDDRGNFWLGGWASGLKYFIPGSGKFEGWLPSPEFKGEGAFNIISGQQFYDGRLWVASHDKGLGIFDTATKKFSFVRDWNLPGTEALHNQVTDLYLSDDVLWIGTGRGLFKLDIRSRFFDIYNLKGMRFGSCLPDLRTGCLIPDQPSKILLPTWTCGIYEFDLKTGENRPVYFNVKNEAETFLRLDISKTMYDSRNVLWIASNDGIIRIENGVIQKIQPLPTLPNTGQHKENFTVCVAEDTEGNIWAATMNGILLFRKGSKEYIKYKLEDLDAPPGLSDRISDITIDPDGNVWFLRIEGEETDGIGFSVYHKNEGTFHTFPVSTPRKYPSYSWFEMAIDKNRNVWVASEYGLLVFNSNDPSRTLNISSIDGLVSDNCYSPVIDTQGNVWIASNSGLSVINPQTATIKNITVDNGLPDADITSLFLTSDGTLCVGFHKEWFAILRAERMKFQENNTKISITSIDVNGTEIPVKDTIIVPYNFSFVKIEFSPLNFLPSNYNIYHIQIDNKKTETKYLTDINELTLSGLAPGKYTIRILSENKFTGKKSPPVEILLYVKPAFWQTWWFKGISGLLLFLLLCIIIWWRYRVLKNNQRREIEINKRVAESEMDALKSQMNPHFIFNALNAIHHFIWKKNPGDASEYLTKFARLIRTVLENSRQKWIPLAEDIKALEYYIQLESLHLEYGLEYSIIIAESVDPEFVMVPPLVLQPFVENSVKHGFQNKKEKGKLSILISAVENELLCEIDDNGKGRRHTGINTDHNSLGTTIINERLEIINYLNGTNARYMYEDKYKNDGSASGTKVYLFLPLIFDK